MLAQQYISEINTLINKIQNEELDKIRAAANLVARSIQNGGVLHVFGCGHSHILCEELFYRAGGLAPINPILESSLMLHEGAMKSSELERVEWYAPILLKRYDIQPQDVMLIISTSGINGVPVGVAIEAKRMGLEVIAITSQLYNLDKSRHSSGKRLWEVADIVLNNYAPHGDALLEVPGWDVRVAPGSTVTGAIIINSIVAQTAEILSEHAKPPVFQSGNVDGGKEANELLLNQYKSRLKHL